MIPEGSITLDSILDGILDEEQSQSGISLSGSASPTSSSISASSPFDFKTKFVSCPSTVVGGGETLDPNPSIPCISIKTELPDSCSTDIMMEFTDSDESQDSPRQGVKMMEPVTVVSRDLIVNMPSFSLINTGRQFPTSAQIADNLRILPTFRLIPQECIKEDEGSKRICVVCGDVASGFHYGVSSCEACKAFFKRTIQGNIDYCCPASGDCEINKRRRKACQACRFQKCLRMGMLKEGVRLDRVRGGRQKYRRISEHPFNTLQPKKTTLEDIQLLHALNRCEPDPIFANPDLSLASSEFKTIALLSDLCEKELVATIGWAKQIPAFTGLSLNDQMQLLHASWSEILTFNLCFRSLPKSNGNLCFAPDFSISEQEAKNCGLSQYFHYCTHLTNRLASLGVRKEEFLFLKAILICNGDVKIEGEQALKMLRDNILTSLSDCVTVIRSGNSLLHVQNLLLVLPSVRQGDALLARFWQSVRQQQKVILNKLLVEMLDAQLAKAKQ